ncbi:dickkopf-related protein 3-like [Ptychodera flava]|uniref:dickkopf-related protein 3-like n=1 Tax=Ptychodera flava TaxID=63121 RepID=UPI00396A1975
MANTLKVVLLFLAVTAVSEAYIWSWMWSGPYPPSSENSPDMSNHPRNLQRVRNSASNETRVIEPPCTNDKSCGRGRFCDRHYGNCRYHKRVNEPCRRDGHCQKGHDCMFGKCVKAFKPGSMGARCKHDRDCSPEMCCARQHGESICKAKLKVGAKCYVPEGGMEYTINTICPCEEGLVCMRTPLDESSDELEWRYWTDFDQMRCHAFT